MKLIKTFLKRIKDTNKFDINDTDEKRFYRVYEGILFRTVIPPINSYSGLYALTQNGRNLLSD